ncbi:PREDICTED: F-box only protein 40 [Nanorana parkeri]|uniref:F-box only protein 40 n=1 Tax=Nanorana parkeri TaxID=125878 RepID=UPI000854F21B|nr:PREDICTED: F-box only protein 40 [Nanorana parkeri]
MDVLQFDRPQTRLAGPSRVRQEQTARGEELLEFVAGQTEAHPFQTSLPHHRRHQDRSKETIAQTTGELLIGKATKPRPGEHRHCQNCFNKRCQAPINSGVSCVMISCRSHCGATFHMCKEEEHQLLCPNDWVPCLNSVFGCPFYMNRCKQARHLKVCPASVVCCSMEWNRWPILDKDQTLYENLLKEEESEECLDLALSLQDQKVLFRSLKLAELFPELSEEPQNTISLDRPDEGLEAGAVGGTDPSNVTYTSSTEEGGLTQFEREALARGQLDHDFGQFSKWEAMFSKELRASEYLEKAAGQSTSASDGTSNTPGGKPKEGEKQPESDEAKKDEELKRTHMELREKTGLAPWQEGVLERLKSEVDCGSYNMYIVHHGSMLIRFGQMAACTPREKDFVYGNLEAQTVETVCTFKVPTSYCGRRAKLGDDNHKKEKDVKLVDTSDLGLPEEDLSQSKSIYTILMCALERELKGHGVSQMKALDGLLIDFGTQTYNFGQDPFTKKTVLLDLITEKEMRRLGLKLDILSESVSGRHNKSNSSFTFSCQLFFRRDEFSSHFKNAHCDIQSSLGGWFQQRCPLAYLGCTYLQNRFRPAGVKSRVIYNKQLKTFAVKPLVDCSLYDGVRPNLSRSHRGKSKDSLSNLPLEVLQHVAGFLDSFSLCQLSQVSSLMRDVCTSLLHERGMVHLLWEKKTYSHGGSSWRCRKKVWNFSSLFSPVHHWTFDDISSVSEHLKVCPFNSPERKEKPFQLPSVLAPQHLRRKL